VVSPHRSSLSSLSLPSVTDSCVLWVFKEILLLHNCMYIVLHIPFVYCMRQHVPKSALSFFSNLVYQSRYFDSHMYSNGMCFRRPALPIISCLLATLVSLQDPARVARTSSPLSESPNQRDTDILSSQCQSPLLRLSMSVILLSTYLVRRRLGAKITARMQAKPILASVHIVKQVT
jgi:hypothetical protein